MKSIALGAAIGFAILALIYTLFIVFMDGKSNDVIFHLLLLKLQVKMCAFSVMSLVCFMTRLIMEHIEDHK